MGCPELYGAMDGGVGSLGEAWKAKPSDGPNPKGADAVAVQFEYAYLAQSVEHTLGKGEVAGSIPAVGTNSRSG